MASSHTHPSSQKIETFSKDGCIVNYIPTFFDKDTTDNIYQTLLENANWQSETALVFNKLFVVKRKMAYYGTSSYMYSGFLKTGEGWPEWLIPIKEKVENYLGCTFNFALMNFYKDGDDYIGYHSDDEKDLIPGSVIASLSFGAERDFCFQKKYVSREKEKTITLKLANGSLITMGGDTQKKYKHSIPKRKRCKEGRINITFRQVKE